jgi:hypothetical protein
MYSGISGHCGNGLAFLGKFEEGKVVLEKGFKNALELNEKNGMGWVELQHSVLSYLEGDANNTLDHAQGAFKYFEKIGLELHLGITWCFLGAGYYPW